MSYLSMGLRQRVKAIREYEQISSIAKGTGSIVKMVKGKWVIEKEGEK